MTTPVNFNSPDRIIRMALKDAGFLQEGEDPSSETFADCINRLNDILNFEQTQGLKLWLQYDLTIPLVAGQAVYTIGPGGNINMVKPTRILDDGYYLDSSNNRRNLIMLSRDEYMSLSNPTGQGAVTSYFPQKNRTSIDLTLWLIPDSTAATGTVHVLIQQQVDNLVSVTDSLTFPLEWFMFLRWALAADISVGQPEAVLARCKEYAESYRRALEDWDVEDASTRFTPDTRAGSYSGRAFR